MIVLDRSDGMVRIEERAPSLRRVSVRPAGGRRAPRDSCDTAYPVELIRAILDVKGAAWVCDEIAREEDPREIQRAFEGDFLPYVPPQEFEGKRILDFGCGAGASTMVLARMFPRSQVVGLELQGPLLELARHRRAYYRYPNVSLLRSQRGDGLPGDLGAFDFVVMSAVFEHLLPEERRRLMPQLWQVLAPGGCLLLNQTPHRFFPFESHTTNLPLINYLPDAWALRAARRFSRRTRDMSSWEALLRQGIRGATEREVLRSLGASAADAAPRLLPPRAPGYRDRVDVWYAALSPRHRALKRACRELLRVVERAFGTTLVTNLTLAIGKGRCAAH
jgi:SAM-dependent methyltransferase